MSALTAVAPRAGAWVEIPPVYMGLALLVESLLVQERGLKYEYPCERYSDRRVAPRAGAWVEIMLPIGSS